MQSQKLLLLNTIKKLVAGDVSVQRREPKVCEMCQFSQSCKIKNLSPDDSEISEDSAVGEVDG